MKHFSTSPLFLFKKSNFFKNLIAVFICIFVLSKIQAQSGNPTVSLPGSIFKICATGATQTVTVNISVPAGYGAINYFVMSWGDGTPDEKIPGSQTSFTFNHTYQLTNFFNTCLDSKKFQMALFTFLKDGTDTNNGQIITIINPPKADFDINPNPGCKTKVVIFSDKTCPTSGVKKNWQYGDGTPSDSIPSHIYKMSGTYNVKLTATNFCGSDIKTQSVTIVDFPKAVIKPDSGFLQPIGSPLKVCLGNNGSIVKLDGSVSLNEQNYKWSQVSGPKSWFFFYPPLLSNLSFARIKFIEKGDYIFKLTVDNECNRPHDTTVVIKVIKADILSLNHQVDTCLTFSYEPKPKIAGVIYTIDGVVVNSFPTPLQPRLKKYLISAFLPNDCGNQMAADSFFIRIPSPLSGISPSKDSVLCQSNIKFMLKGTPSGGIWTGQNVTKSGNDYFFEPSTIGNTKVTYSVGSGTCKLSIDKTFTVVKDVVVSIVKQDDVCTGLNYTPNPYNPLDKIVYTINNTPQITFPVFLPINAQPYYIVATYNGNCGSQIKKDTFFVQNIEPVSIISPSKDTIVCQSATKLKLIGAPSGGVWSGTNVSLVGNNYFFDSNVTGVFTLTYTRGTGTCEQSTSVKVTVVKDVIVNIIPQIDVCNGLNYTPNPYNPLDKIIYTINNVVQNTFPTNLPISATPYIVTASFDGICGKQLKSDTFLVQNVQGVSIISPSKDTIICQSPTKLKLIGAPSGGVWSGTNVSLSGKDYFFDNNTTGVFTLTYTRGAGTCEQSTSVKITVVKDVIVSIIKQDDVCNELMYTPNPYNPSDKIVYTINGVPQVLFPVKLAISATPYYIEASFNGVCGKQLKSDTFFVQDIKPVTILLPNKDTSICLGSILNIQTNLPDGVWSGANITTKSPTNFEFNPIIEGDYTLIYTRGTATCEQKITLKVKVIKEFVLQLGKQVDTCDAFIYKPMPYDPSNKVDYYVNDVKTSSFPLLLPTSTKPYIIKAIYNGFCGKQEIIDTFTISEPIKVKIQLPSKDTAVCVNDTDPVQIQVSPSGGYWIGNVTKSTNGFEFLPNTVGKTQLIYVRGKGTCEQRDTINIDVQGIIGKVEDITLCRYSPITALKATPPGGKFSAVDCPSCVDAIGNFNVKNVGNKTEIVVNYEVTNPLGCKNTSKGTVKIEDPLADFEVVKSCQKEPIIIDDSKTIAQKKEWFIDGKLSTISATGILPFGQHSIKLIAYGVTCNDTLEKVFYVVQKPKLTFFDVLKVGDCAPIDITFQPKGSAQTDVNYRWDFGRKPSDTLSIFQPSAITYKSVGYAKVAYTVSLTAYNGCGNFVKDTMFALRSKPQTELGIDSSKVGCSPYIVTLTNRSKGDIQSCKIDLGNGTKIDTCIKFVTAQYVSPDVSKKFFAILSASNDCGTSMDTVIIDVIPPGVRAFYNLPSYDICAFDTIQFKDASTPTPLKVTWDFDDGGFSNNPKPKHVFDKPNSTYNVVLKAYGTCGYDSILHVVKTKKAPVVDFSVPLFACEKQEIKITNKSGKNNYAYYWTTNGSVDSTHFDFKHTFEKGDYTDFVSLKIINFEGCSNQLSKKIFVRRKPEPDFELNLNQGCTPITVQLANKSKFADTFLWKFGNGETSQLKNPSVTYTQNGKYDIKLIASFDNVCVDSIQYDNVFFVYDCQCFVPNAFSPNGEDKNELFTVFGNDALSKILKLEVYNRWGNLVYKGIDLKPESEGWNGTFNGISAPIDVYTYLLTVQYIDGSQKAFKGDITLMR
jgi:gliding motility-associated-like protein